MANSEPLYLAVDADTGMIVAQVLTDQHSGARRQPSILGLVYATVGIFTRVDGMAQAK